MARGLDAKDRMREAVAKARTAVSETNALLAEVSGAMTDMIHAAEEEHTAGERLKYVLLFLLFPDAGGYSAHKADAALKELLAKAPDWHTLWRAWRFGYELQDGANTPEDYANDRDDSREVEAWRDKVLAGLGLMQVPSK